MKTTRHSSSRPGRQAGFTLVEILISMTILVLVMALTLACYMFCLRMMYKDTQRLITNASLRSFLAQISKETLDASTFYLFPYYTKLDGSVDPAADIVLATGPEIDATGTDYDKWVTHGDCLVLVTKTDTSTPVKIRQIRIYYRITTSQATVNAEAPIWYYETADWGEDNAGTGYTNTHLFSNLATELNAINLNLNPKPTGARQINPRSKGRKVPSPYTGYTAGDLYPIFSTESPDVNPSNGFVSINVEFINGTTNSNMLSSSSFNYTISPRR
jgi:prepilin-type N-terminal cleavage/methylation domain-containing protein